ncbi:hypothetical protein C8R46DRAFT_360897 [Mycena filopes]|nr:hypothetical protein C8R46DRAFT_360897 [Mycena filopes]
MKALSLKLRARQSIAMKSLALSLPQWGSRFQKRVVDGRSDSSRAALPIELWDIIIHELTDEDLLRMSEVSSTFNAFAISEYLARNHISATAKEISGPTYLVRAMARSCVPLAVEHLTCDFRHFDVRRDLLALRRFVPRAQNLIDLELCFAASLFYAHRYDQRPVEYSSRDVMGVLCGVLSAMACRAPKASPVLVMGPFAMFTCRPEDIGGWRMDWLQFEARAEWTSLATKFLGRVPQLSLQTVVGDSGGERGSLTRAQVLKDIRNVDVKVQRAPGIAHTLLVFNGWSITLLDLDDPLVPAPQLNAALEGLTFPFLATLMISRAGIDPAVLGAFLARQTKLRELRFLTEKPSGPLISPPLAHPTLSRIEARGAESICPALDALHLSPLLDTFAFTLTSSLSSLTPAFRRIAQRSVDAHLELTISFDSSYEDVAPEGDVASTARTLRCISSVAITCVSVAMGLMTLPWLALFPALARVRFSLGVDAKAAPRADDPYLVEEYSWPEAELERLMWEVKRVLAHVPNISGRRF